MNKKLAVKNFILLLILAFATAFSAGCGSTQKENDNGKAKVYYLDRDETGLESEVYDEAKYGSVSVDGLLKALADIPSKPDSKRILGDGVLIISYQAKDGQLMINYDERYLDLTNVQEVLFRASMVMTLCQASDVDSLSFQVAGEPLADETGIPYSVFKAEDFVDLANDDLGAYVKDKVRLYYAEPDGEKLMARDRYVVHSANVQLEKVIVDEILKGPDGDGLLQTLPAGTKVNSVNVKDGTCYVDFSEPISGTATKVTEETALYSIVNSLTEITGINKVQISINGETDTTFMGSISLKESFERNLDMVERR